MLIRVLRIFILFLLLSFFIGLVSNIWVVLLTRSQIEENISSIPKNTNVMILGTSKTFASGSENLFFKNRITASKILIDSISPRNVILSGSHPSEYYNEPEDMSNSLSQLGVKTVNFIIDDKGDNTFNSIMNYKKKFKQEPLVIVTQKFHSYRAILICKQLNVNAIVYPAAEVSADISNRPLIREVFARIKALFDFYLF